MAHPIAVTSSLRLCDEYGKTQIDYKNFVVVEWVKRLCMNNLNNTCFWWKNARKYVVSLTMAGTIVGNPRSKSSFLMLWLNGFNRLSGLCTWITLRKLFYFLWKKPHRILWVEQVILLSVCFESHVCFLPWRRTLVSDTALTSWVKSSFTLRTQILRKLSLFFTFIWFEKLKIRSFIFTVSLLYTFNEFTTNNILGWNYFWT